MAPEGFRQDPHEHHSLSKEFRELARLCQDEHLTLRQIFWHVKDRGPALCMLVLGLPFMTPLPMPGLSIPFGVLIVLWSVALLRNRPPYMPKVFLDKPLPPELAHKILSFASRFFARWERWIRPRGARLFESLLVRTAAATMMLFCGFLLALPLPPGTNGPPASVVVACAIALMEKDALVLALGGVLFILNLLLFGTMGLLGYEALHRLFLAV